MLISFGLVTIVFIGKLIAPAAIQVQGWTSLFLSIFFFGGLSAFLLSVALEYLTNLMLHTQGKPTFFVVDRTSDKVALPYFEERDKL